MASEIRVWPVGNVDALMAFRPWDWAGGSLRLIGHPPAAL